MPNWIKAKKEQAVATEQYEVVDVNSLNEMQQLAYHLVNSYFDNESSEKDYLCLIIIGLAGTGRKATLLMVSATCYKINVQLQPQLGKPLIICKV